MKLFTIPLVKLTKRFIARNDAKRLKQFKPSDDIIYRFNLCYGQKNVKENQFDIYYPKSNDNGITLLDIHGGGYIYSYKENNVAFGEYFVKSGFKVVNTNYTLNQGHIDFKLTIKEMFDLLHYLEKHNQDLNLNLNNFYIMGDSAGGHIALMVALTNQDEQLQKYYQVQPLKYIHIKGVGLNSPVYDFLDLHVQMNKLMFKKAYCYFVGDHYLDLKFFNQNNPAYYIKNKLIVPNFKIFVSTSKNDFLKSHAFKLKQDYDKTILDYCDSKNKKINHIHNVIHLDDKEGINTNNKMIDFFKS